MGSTERISYAANYEPIASKKKFNHVRSKRKCPEACTIPLCRPLRIFQFLTTLLLFGLVVYLTVKPAGSSSTAESKAARTADVAVASMTKVKPSVLGTLRTESKPSRIEEKAPLGQTSVNLRLPQSGQYLTHLASILLITLTSSYLFFMAIEIISQFGYRGLPDSPMLLFNFLGMVLFGIAGALMVYYQDSNNTLPELIFSQVLCFVISALFLIEITMVLAWWRLKCISWKKCSPYTPDGQRGVKPRFDSDCPCDIDTEFDKCDIATSISHVDIPLETNVDSAVKNHGLRKIGIGHRRQYVDRPSSVSALSSVQIAEIQTEINEHCVTECQTQRTELRESIMQTSSRCELCNRQMDNVHPSENISAPPLPSQGSTHLRAQASQLTTESIQFIASQKARTSVPQYSQQGHCAMCPALFHMMRGGMASPCCQSCNCGETAKDQPRPDDRVPYLLHETPQHQRTDIKIPETQQEFQHKLPKTSTITTTLTATGTDSTPSMPPEKSEVELRGSNKVVNEGNRYRPSKKVPRVYETRPCPTHGSGLAAKMAGLPETVSRVTLSSISLRRNKRTQTPSKTSTVSEVKGDTDKDESKDDIDVTRLEDAPQDYDYEKEESIGKHQTVTFARSRDGSMSDRNSGIVQDVNKKIISNVELRKRLSKDPRISYAPATKSVLDSLAKKSDSSTLEEMDEKVEGYRRPKLSGKILYRAERSDPRLSEQVEKELNWLRDKSSIEESYSDVEKSSAILTPEETDDEGQSFVKDETLTPLESELSAIEEENSDSGTSTVIQKESSAFSNVSQQESRISSTPVLRLRLEERGQDFGSSTQRIGESDETIRRTSSRRSVSKGLSSKTHSTIPSRSNTRNYELTDDFIQTRKSGKSNQQIRSPTSKASAASQDRSGKIERNKSDSYVDFPGEDGQFSENITPLRLSELKDVRPEFSERDDDESEPQESSVAESEVLVPSSQAVRRKSITGEKINHSLVSRLRREKSGEDLEGSKRQFDEIDDMTSRSSLKSRSTLKGLLSKAASAISSGSMTRKGEVSDTSIGKPRNDKSSRVIRSPTPKTSALSRERSGNIDRNLSGSYADFSGQDGTPSEHRTSARWNSSVERSEDESSQITDEDLAETIIQEGSGAESEKFASPPRMSSTRPSVHENIGSRSSSRSQLENVREDSKSSLLRVSGHDQEIRRLGSKTRSTSKRHSSKTDSGRQSNFSERETSSRSSQLELKSEEGSLDRVDDDDSETIIKKRSGTESEVSAPSLRLSSTKPIVHENVDSRPASSLQLKKSGEDSKVSNHRAGSDDVIRSTISKSRSTSKGQLSKGVSAISSGSKTGKDQISKASIGKRRSGPGSQVIRLPSSKASIVSQDKPEKDLFTSYSDLSGGQRKFTARGASSRSSLFGEKSDDESTERDDEAEDEIENSSVGDSEISASSPRVSRTEPNTDQIIPTRATSRIQSEKDGEHTNYTERRISADDVVEPTRSKGISSGSKTRMDEISEVSLGKRSKEGSEIIRSSQEIDRAIPKSFSDLSGGQRKFSGRGTSGRLSEFGERGEEESPEKDEQVQSETKIENLGASVSKVFASSSKLSRTILNMDQMVEQTKDGIEETIDEPRRAPEIPIERHSKTPTEESRTESSSEFIYVPAPWSSNGSVLQRKSRIESVDEQMQTPVANPNTESHGPSPDGPPASQCITNEGCPTFEMRVGGVSSICADEAACVDACSCRIKSILMRQRSVNPHREPVQYPPAGPNSTRQYPSRQLHFPRILSWASRRKEPLPDATRSRETSRSSTQPKRFVINNFCHVS